MQFNDKSPCFDGEIIVYNSEKLLKKNIEDTVKVQIKGTTKYKRVKGSKTSYSIAKEDLEVFKKTGKGVIYFLVVIDRKTSKMQPFYKSLTPLEIERNLSILRAKKQKSLAIDFKKVKENQLEQICLYQIKRVRKQASFYIGLGENKKFSTYFMEYDILPSEMDTFNPLETPMYIYGIEDGNEYPLKAAIPNSINRISNVNFNIEEEDINISIEICESLNNIKIIVENILEFNFSKVNNKGNLKLNKINNLLSYVKALKTLKYLLINNELPFDLGEIKASIDNKKEFENLGLEIKKYERALEICKKIGIKSNYSFEHIENSELVIEQIIDFFGDKNYEQLVNGYDENHNILKIEIAGRLNLLLLKDNEDELYYNLFDRSLYEKVGAYLPKNEGPFNPNLDEYYSVSIFTAYPLKELIELTNFEFELYQDSLLSEKHDKSLESNNTLALEMINIYFDTKDFRFLSLAQNLLHELINKHSDNLIYKLNIILIHKIEGITFNEEEEEFLGTIIEEDDLVMKFGAYVLMDAKIPANKIFQQLSEEEKKLIEEFPIGTLLRLL